MRRSTITITALLLFLMSVPASAAITHRWDFEIDPNDVVGGLPGTLIGDAATVTGGSLVLGGTDDWMEMPGDQIAINAYPGITMEMWYTPVNAGNATWSMLAYFGGNNSSATWMGINYVFMTTARNDNKSRAAISVDDTSTPWVDEAGADGPEYDDGIKHHMAATVDASTIALYIDGKFVSSAPLDDETIANISQQLAFLGKGGYMDDPEWNGSIQEFRLYNKALNTGEVAYSHFFGEADPQVFAIQSVTPAYGQTLVSLTPTLEWTLEPGIVADHYDLYIGTDPNIADPNKPDVSGISDIVVTGLTTNSYTVQAGDAFANSANVYWRVDTTAADMTFYQGAGMMFTTIPQAPVIVTQPVDWLIGDPAGPPSVFTVVAANADTYKWYKEGDPTVLSSTDTLTVYNFVLDEGRYYCEVSHSANPAVVVTTSANRGHFLTKRLVGWWKMENNMQDSIQTVYPDALPHHGSFVAGSGAGIEAYTAGETNNGTAMVFADTAGTHVDVDAANESFFDFYPKGLTATFWVRTTLNAWRLPFSKLQVGVAGWLFGTNTGTNTAMQFIFETKGSFASSNAVNLRDGNWHMVTGMYDAEHKLARIYVDGTNPVEVALDLSNDAYTSNTSPVQIGGRGLGTSIENSINGTIDEVRIYSYPLTPDEVADLYYQTRGAFCQTYPAYDYDRNCLVNLADFVTFATRWLECGRYPETECPQ